MYGLKWANYLNWVWQVFGCQWLLPFSNLPSEAQMLCQPDSNLGIFSPVKLHLFSHPLPPEFHMNWGAPWGKTLVKRGVHLVFSLNFKWHNLSSFYPIVFAFLCLKPSVYNSPRLDKHCQQEKWFWCNHFPLLYSQKERNLYILITLEVSHWLYLWICWLLYVYIYLYIYNIDIYFTWKR